MREEKDSMIQRLVVFLLSALASLVGLDPELHDPTTWFAAEAVLAVVVAGTVVYLRKTITISGFAVVLLSVATGAGLSVMGYIGELFAAGTTILQAVLFGVGSGWAASMGWDLFQALRPKTLPAGS